MNTQRDAYQAAAAALCKGSMEPRADRHGGAASHDLTPPHLRLGLALLEGDRPEEARAALQGASPPEEETASATTVPLHHWALGYSSWLVGRWDRADIEVRAGLAAAEDGGGAPQGAWWAGVGVVVAIHRDAIEAGRSLLSRVQRLLAADAAACPLWSQGAEALLAEAEGRPELALQVLAEGWDRAGAARHLSGYRLFGPELVRLALLQGDRRRAASVVREVEEHTACLSVAGAQAAALRCRGVLEDDPCVLLRAVAALQGAPRPLELAKACEEAAGSLLRADRAKAASSLFDQALTAYQSLGAIRDLARLVSTSRVRGDQGGAAGPQERASSVPTLARPLGADLTVRELEVLELLAAGVGTKAIAERLFLSPNTVRNHAQNILRKLLVHSRLEAVSVAVREGLVHPPRRASANEPHEK